MKYIGEYKPKLGVILKISFISIVFTAIIIIYGVPLLLQLVKNIPLGELISIIAVMLTMFGLTWQFVQYKLKAIPKLKINLDVKVVKSHAIITSTVENVGGRRVTPLNVYLFIDEGLIHGGSYDFPFLLKHEGGEYDCILAKICKTEKLRYPKDSIPNNYQNTYAELVQLKHLSYESIIYIDPGEGFSEDVVIKLPKNGVYRVILVYTAKDADCICASKEFIITETENYINTDQEVVLKTGVDSPTS